MNKNIAIKKARKDVIDGIFQTLKESILNDNHHQIKNILASNKAIMFDVFISRSEKEFQEGCDLLHKLIDKGLVTSEMLAASPAEGPAKGANITWILAVKRKYDLLEKLIDK